jgi:hypothetical protein
VSQKREKSETGGNITLEVTLPITPSYRKLKVAIIGGYRQVGWRKKRDRLRVL